MDDIMVSMKVCNRKQLVLSGKMEELGDAEGD